MTYYFLLVFSKIVCILPWKFCEIVGDLLTKFLWIFVPAKRKNIARDNVKRCLKVDDSEADRIARASFIRFGRLMFEFLRFPILKSKMKSYVEIENLDYLLEYKAASEKNGAIIVTCHSDNWELMGGAFAQYGIPLVGVAKKQKSEGADKFINEFRTLIGMHITYRSGVREMYKMMDEGHFIGLIMDQDVGRHDGVIVKFFNRATNYVTGAASMSRFKSIPIFPAFMHKNSDGTHTLEVYPPLSVEKTSDKRADIQNMTQKLATFTEEHIRRYPEEWFWLHDRWKSMRVEFTPEEVAEFNRRLNIE